MLYEEAYPRGGVTPNPTSPEIRVGNNRSNRLPIAIEPNASQNVIGIKKQTQTHQMSAIIGRHPSADRKTAIRGEGIQRL